MTSSATACACHDHLGSTSAPVPDAVLETLRQGTAAADIARAIWTQANTLRIRRAEPVWTARGKFMPLRTRGKSAGWEK